MVNPPPADLARKVGRLDNDVQSIYEMLAGIAASQARQGNRLDEIAGELTGHTEQLGAILDLLRRGQP